jgi:hypothetical protein
VSEPKQNAEPPNIGAVFQSALNRQGYPFQYAVIRRADELWNQRCSRWVFEASEFPVEVQGYHTRIDFVLSQYSESQKGPFRFLIAECKRANPALHDWLFARAPYVRRGGPSIDILVEFVRREGRDLTASLGRLDGSKNIYHVAVEVKGAGKGDSSGSGRGAIEGAATQVLRGLNGLIEFFSRKPRYAPDNSTVIFIPVIFTAAKIWATDVDISAADVAKGQVALDSADVSEKPWLWLQYHVSPGLKHTVDLQLPTDERVKTDLGHLLEIEYARAIAVVGPNGIDGFLASQLWTS